MAYARFFRCVFRVANTNYRIDQSVKNAACRQYGARALGQEGIDAAPYQCTGAFLLCSWRPALLMFAFLSHALTPFVTWHLPLPVLRVQLSELEDQGDAFVCGVSGCKTMLRSTAGTIESFCAACIQYVCACCDPQSYCAHAKTHIRSVREPLCCSTCQLVLGVRPRHANLPPAVSACARGARQLFRGESALMHACSLAIRPDRVGRWRHTPERRQEKGTCVRVGGGPASLRVPKSTHDV